ncbi:MAG: isoprenylcysteine carboxylmethyltransferase family protein [Bacteroidota bacterium]|nr:isoprenylcysteine carboxylmethyltransferase family protein [Bacteroidota bacterium]
MKRNANYKSDILVGMQMVCIFLLVVRIPAIKSDLWVFFVSLLGFILGFWAVVTMKLDNLSIAPDVRQNAKLVTAGPYKLIRHPMYSAVLLIFLPFVIDSPSAYFIVVFMALLITLLIKLNYEEQLLRNHFEDYATYSKNSWKLIPFIY